MGGTYISSFSSINNLPGTIESSYYGIYEEFFRRRCTFLGYDLTIVQHVNQDNTFPDFSVYRDHDGSPRLLAFIEAKSPGTNLEAAINKSNTDEDHQFSKYLRLSGNLILTDFRSAKYFQNGTLVDDTINFFDGFEPSNVPSALNSESCSDNFDRLITAIEQMDFPIPLNANGAFKQLGKLGLAVKGSFLAGSNSADGSTLKLIQIMMNEAIKRLIVGVNGVSNLEKHSNLIAQLIPISLLIIRRDQEEQINLLENDDLFIRNDFLRILFRLVISTRDYLEIETIFSETINHLNQIEAEELNLHTVEGLEAAFLEISRHIDPKWARDHGFVRTPEEVVEYMISRLDYSLKQKPEYEQHGLGTIANDLPVLNILDPCVGTGRFYIQILDRIWRNLSGIGIDVRRNYMRRFIGTMEQTGSVVAFDIQPMCLIWTNLMVMEWCSDNGVDTNGLKPNIRLVDTLTPTGHFGGLDVCQKFFPNNLNPDVIIGNPPWGAHEKAIQDDGKMEQYIGNSEHGHYQNYMSEARNKRGTSPHSGPKKEVAAAFTIRLHRILADNGIMSLIVPDSIARKETWWSVRQHEFVSSRDIYVDFLDGGKDSDRGNNVFSADSEQPTVIFVFEKGEGDTTLHLREGFTGMTTGEKLTHLNSISDAYLDGHADYFNWINGYQQISPSAKDWLKWRLIPENVYGNVQNDSVTLWDISIHGLWSAMADELGGRPLNVNRNELIASMRGFLGDDQNYTWETANGQNPGLATALRFGKGENEARRRWEASRPFNNDMAVPVNYYPMVQVYGYVAKLFWGKSGKHRERYRNASGSGGFFVIPGQTKNRIVHENSLLVASPEFYPANVDFVYNNGKPFAITIHLECDICGGTGIILPVELENDQSIPCVHCDGNGLRNETAGNLSENVVHWLDEMYGQEFAMLESNEKSIRVWNHILSVMSSNDYSATIRFYDQDTAVPFPQSLEVFNSSSQLGRDLSRLQRFQGLEEGSEWLQLYSVLNQILLSDDEMMMALTSIEGLAINVENNFSISGYSQTNQWRSKPLDLVTLEQNLVDSISDRFSEILSSCAEKTISGLEQIFEYGFCGIKLRRRNEDSPMIVCVPRIATEVRIGNDNASVLQRWLCMHSNERAPDCGLQHLTTLRDLIIRLTVIALMREDLNENLSFVLLDFAVFNQEGEEE